MGQIDSRTTHIEDRKAQHLFRFRSCSSGQTLRNEFVDQISHCSSLSSGEIFQARHLGIIEEKSSAGHADICILDTEICRLHLDASQVDAPQRLSRPARRALQDGTVEVSVSGVSFWEMSLKQALGQLILEGETIEGLVDAAAAHRCELLPLTVQVASTFHHLPLLGRHRDLFDRMLVWQAIQHDLTLVSRDRAMQAYQTEGLKILW
jgi:PIN domain nuclease of toxin-antitoxin system